MNYVIRGLSAEPFRHLYGLTDEELATHGAKRYVCDKSPGFPDRIEMRDAEIGETLLLLNHTSMEKESPYKATHAIFIREGAEDIFEAENKIPPVMYDRVLSLRAFDPTGMIIDADIAQGDDIETAVLRMFENEDVEHIDAHNAGRGCFSGRITRS